MSTAEAIAPVRLDHMPDQLRRALCRRSVLAWAAHCWPRGMKAYWHTQLIDDRLNRLLSHENDSNQLMISCPPRVGKTMNSIVYGATQYLGNNPDHHVWVVTHSQTTADKFGRKARLAFQHNAKEIFGVGLDPKVKSNACWGVAGHEGTFNSIGWGGGITGNRVDLLIVDDLIKTSEEALSQNIRDKIWDWWDGTATQRIQDNIEVRTKTLSIQTRWHVQDLNGRLIDQENGGGGMKWDHLILPAIADRHDIVVDGQVVMRKGESICEEILPLSTIQRIQRTKSRYWWEANYQQRPIMQDGMLWSADCFPPENFVDKWPHRLKYLVVTCDPATGRNLRDGDYSAICALGCGYDGKLYAEFDMEKSGPQETTVRLAKFCRRLPMPADIVGIEANGFQFLLATMASETFESMDVAGRIEPYDIDERGVPVHKEDRIAEIDPLIVNKAIHWVKSEGTQLCISQLRNFPSQDHDDGPDSLELATWIMANLNPW